MQLESIGIIQSCFKEKFSTPRQSGLVPAADARICIEKKFSNWDAFKDLASIDFVWLIFSFHLNQINSDNKEWYPTVRPPRLGGNQRLGVFATRSPFRPNPLGLSLVKLDKLEYKDGKIILYINGHDLVEGTPIYDIKPYHPQADMPWERYQSGWIDTVEDLKLPVHFEVEVLDEKIRQKIIQVLQLDPRPRFHHDENRIYGNIIDDINLKWRVSSNQVIILDIKKIK